MTLVATSLLLGFNVFSWLISPFVFAMGQLLAGINSVFHNYGWSIILLAGLVKLVLWPLSAMQLRSMAKMQQISPLIKALQEKYKGTDPETQQKLNTELMALYRAHDANPMAGCLPALLPIPIMIAFYQAVMDDRSRLVNSTWMWIGSPISQSQPHIFATDLAHLDLVLLGLYMVSMFFTVRLSSPAVDPQQAQQQKFMAFISPAMIGYFGYRYEWPSALILYWLTFNVFSMLQQFLMTRKKAAEQSAVAATTPITNVTTNGKSSQVADSSSSSSSSSSRRSARKKRARR